MMNDTHGAPDLTIYAAGSCHHNPGGCGGWGCIITNHRDQCTAKLSGCLPAAESMTNIRVELVSVLEALKAIPGGSTVVFWIKSNHVPKAFTLGRKRTRNLDLWPAIFTEAARHRIEWKSDPAIATDSPMEDAKRMARKETSNAVKMRRIMDDVNRRK
jgi:Ribonuclease HI